VKFALGNHYHQQIRFWAKFEQGQGSRTQKKICIDVNQCCCDVKHVLAPSEWIHKFQSTY